jgi:site-specific DNA-cytosine methylase
VIRSDLTDVDGTARAAAPFGPFDSAEISSPCTDFSPSGRGVEGDRAWVTVTSTLIALRLCIPLVLYENVPKMLSSQAWALTALLLEDAGYLWKSVVVNAANCGVPQDRRRVFVATVRRGLGAETKLLRWQQALEQLEQQPSAPRVTVGDVAPRLGPFYWFNARSSKAACIRSTRTRSPTQRTNCGYMPGRVLEETKRGWVGNWKYRPRLADAARIK